VQRLCLAVALLAVYTAAGAAWAQTATTRPHGELIAADKGFSRAQLDVLYARGTQRVYAGNARATLGMPCGGIAAGQLYVLGDGTLGGFDIDGLHRFSGYGRDNYRSNRPARPIAQGFMLTVIDADHVVSYTPVGDEGYDDIRFVGEYPQAHIAYRAKERDVPPVQVDLTVFSPFIPLDARESAFPATVLRFRLENQDQRVMMIALGGWLENMVGREANTTLTIQRRNRRDDSGGLTGVVMDIVEHRPPETTEPAQTHGVADFESGTYDGWTVSGEAFGTAPASGALETQNPVSGFGGKRLVNSFGGGDDTTGRMVGEPFEIMLPYVTYRIGGGGHAGKTCLNLVVEGKVVRTATGRNNETLELRAWQVDELIGRQAHIEILDEQTGAWGHINVDDITLTNTLPEALREYDPTALNFGNMALTLVGEGAASARWDGQDKFWPGQHQLTKAEAQAGFGEPLVGTVVTQRMALKPGESCEVTFLVSWYFPNLHTDHGIMYANWFTGARNVAEVLARDLDRLTRETELFCDTYYHDTTLPWWLATRLMMPTSTLATGTCQWWRNGRFWAWEGVGCCSGTCTHVWNYAQSHAWLFPEIARSVRSQQDLGAGFDDQTGLVGFRSNRAYAADGQAGTVLKCYREHLLSKDGAFLAEHWPRIKMALEYLIAQDGNEDGIIENSQHNTFDINFIGPNPFVGSLYLAALRAGEEMARLVNEPAAAERYHRIFESGQAWTVAHLFNGEYFEQALPPGADTSWQYGTGCLSDQVFGQNWAHGLGLGYIYPPDKVRSALASVHKYNWATDVAAYNGAYPPERWFVVNGDPGLFVCTWPRGGRYAEPVRYRDEVWTGIEYQAAAGMAWEGMVDEALVLVDAVERRYDGARHNPWNEVECGDHYARALAAWGVMNALLGYTCDGPAKRLTFEPRLTPDNCAAFFSGPEGWGLLSQKREDGKQTDAIEVRWGTLELGELRLRTDPNQRPETELQLTVAVRDEPGGEKRTVRAEVEADDTGEVRLRFAPALRLNAGGAAFVLIE